MAEKREKRKAIKRKNAVRIVIGAIAVVGWISIFWALITYYALIGLIFWVVGGVALTLLLTKLIIGATEDGKIVQKAEDLEKSKKDSL